MSEILRNLILINLKRHEDGPSSNTYKPDKEIAAELGKFVREIQDQLDILEKEGKVEVMETFGPTYSAKITPLGLKHLETIS
jgi:hypothetical protein